MDFEFLWKSVLLGVLQGLTEFLPVSSSGHLAIGGNLLGVGGPGVTFEVALHLGTLLAVFAYFRREIISLFISFFTWCGIATGRTTAPEGQAAAALSLDLRIIAGIILGSIPTGIIGVLGKDGIEKMFTRIDIVGALLIVTAAMLTSGELFSRRHISNGRELIKTPNPLQSVVIGVFQGLAIAPGISRSGATVSAGLVMGMEPVAAARFSFLLGIPAMIGAAILSFPDAESIPTAQIAGYIAGSLTAAAVGYAAIATFIGALRRGMIMWFAVYCFLLGSTVIGFYIAKI